MFQRIQGMSVERNSSSISFISFSTIIVAEPQFGVKHTCIVCNDKAQYKMLIFQMVEYWPVCQVLL